MAAWYGRLCLWQRYESLRLGWKTPPTCGWCSYLVDLQSFFAACPVLSVVRCSEEVRAFQSRGQVFGCARFN